MENWIINICNLLIKSIDLFFLIWFILIAVGIARVIIQHFRKKREKK